MGVWPPAEGGEERQSLRVGRAEGYAITKACEGAVEAPGYGGRAAAGLLVCEVFCVATALLLGVRERRVWTRMLLGVGITKGRVELWAIF